MITEKTQPVSEDRALQDGRHSHAERPAKSRRLDGQDRPKRCLFHDSHCSGGQTSSSFNGRIGRTNSTAYRSDCLSRGDPAGGGTPSDHLHRLYPRHGINRVSTEISHHSSGVSTGVSGVCYKPPQSRANPHPGNRISGAHGQLHQNGAKTGEKIKKIRAEAGKILQSHSVSGLALSRLIGKMNAATQAIPMAPLYYRYIPPSMPPRGPTGGSGLLLNSSLDSGGQRGAGMVERPFHSVEQSEPDSSQLLPHHATLGARSYHDGSL